MKGMRVTPNDFVPEAIDRGARQGLPNNSEAEANVLSAMLLSPDVVDDAISELRIDDFYRPAHRELFNAMVSMNERGIPIDSISVVDHLASENKLAAVGGEAYILELVGNTIPLANWEHHAEIVRRDSLLRELIKASDQISRLAYDAPLDAKDAVEQAEGLILKITDREVSNAYRTLTDFMIEAYDEAAEVAAAGGQAHGVAGPEHEPDEDGDEHQAHHGEGVGDIEQWGLMTPRDRGRGAGRRRPTIHRPQPR